MTTKDTDQLSKHEKENIRATKPLKLGLCSRKSCCLCTFEAGDSLIQKIDIRENDNEVVHSRSNLQNKEFKTVNRLMMTSVKV